MKKICLFLSTLILMLALTGCGLFDRAPEPTPTLAPTAAPVEAAPTEAAMAEPTEAPMEEPTEAPAEEIVEEPEEIVEEPIEEVSGESEGPPQPAELEISPELQADLLTYVTLAQETNALVSPVMMAECPPGSAVFPIPEPETNAKRPLDFAPFEAALAEFSTEQATAMDAALTGKTLPEIQELLDVGEFTSEQLLIYYLARIQQYDVNKLNSVMELNPEALAAAQALDSERANGSTRGSMHGIPVLLKDNIAAAAPLHTTAGNYALKDWQADRDAFLVQGLREAGAIIMGKANLSEWANYADPCMPNGFSSLGGQVRHAWGLYDPLGSSTGSAVSVAAGLTPVSVGSETSGSLTQPARTNGVVALRPSQGVISGDYVIPLESNLDTAGPMGHSVTDVAIMLNAMAGTDANDPKTADAVALDGVDFTQFLSLEEAQNLKVGVVQFDLTGVSFLAQQGAITEEEIAELTPEGWQQISDLAAVQILGRATQEIIDALESQGIEVVVIKESTLPVIPAGGEVSILNYGFQNSVNEFLAGLGDTTPLASLAEAVAIINEDPANRAPYGQRYVEWSVATETTAEEYEAAVHGGREYSKAWIDWFKDTHDVDVIMMGTNYQAAGLANIPALTIPTGRVVDSAGQPGEPTGVLITGPYLSDGAVLAVGYALEQALGVEQQPDLAATMGLIAPVTGE